MFVCEQNIIVKVSIVVTWCGSRFNFAQISNHMLKLVESVWFYYSCCWVTFPVLLNVELCTPTAKAREAYPFCSLRKSNTGLMIKSGMMRDVQQKKNVVKPNSLDDKSKMIFFCWQTISCFVNITGRLLT